MMWYKIYDVEQGFILLGEGPSIAEAMEGIKTYAEIVVEETTISE